MSTFEAPAVDTAVLRQIHDLLRIALREAGAVLAKGGCSAEVAWEATGCLMPVLVLLRSLTDAPTGALPDADQIESAYVERQPLRLVKEQK